ncbi:hypothetical protein APHAL10511_003468 [Amanita phalloides]|nr:hypothetical protein APHAL10511_003468 [Amanita phalloides]
MSSKRVASSSLTSEIDKKLKVGLTDDEVKSLNKHLHYVVMNLAQFNKEDVPTSALALTFQQIAINMQGTSHASTIDKSWLDCEDGEKRIKLLSPDDRLVLASIWVEARDKGDWEPLANNALLRVETPAMETGEVRGYTDLRQDQVVATEESWEHPFQGSAAIGLWEHITTHYKHSDNIEVYAPFASIVQSSGMGKSRTVDELAKDHFIIPINLRGARSTGYPPADHSVRDYLTSAISKHDAFDRASAFLEALFMHITAMLTTLNLKNSSNYVTLAREFRSLMTEGQKITGHNLFRENFYKQIIEAAKQLLTQRKSPKHQASSKGTASNDQQASMPSNQEFPPCIAFQQLAAIIPSLHDESKAPEKKSNPFVILAFDEAHTITQRHPGATEEWSIFNELHYALRHLNDLPLFSLFMSTTGKIFQFTSPTEEDLSKRVVMHKLSLIKPYTDLGFDPLAVTITVDGSQNLEKLTEDSQICSLGRPLFSARYLKGSASVKREIIQFAVAKLLNADHTPKKLSNDQLLACLSQRFPIEFNSTNYISQARQVEGHMRICLNISAGFETMATTSSSEPILSEAAYSVMQEPLFNAPRALQLVMDGFSIAQGDRGEILALLLLILARDATVGPADAFGRPETGKRWFSLTDFLYGQIFRKQTGPSTLVDKNSILALGKLSEDFANSQLHFSHFMKVHDDIVIKITPLLLLLGRGAAVLCANSQSGIDAINVFLMNGTKLVKDNAGLILHQIKNDPRYSATPQQHLFDGMDPYKLEILGARDCAVPLIKIVFALAARRPSLHVVRHDRTEKYNNIVYEIWCAGLSPEILGPITQQRASVWDSLLQASYGWKALYKTLDVAADLRRTVTPAGAGHMSHFHRWAELPLEFSTLFVPY